MKLLSNLPQVIQLISIEVRWHRVSYSADHHISQSTLALPFSGFLLTTKLFNISLHIAWWLSLSPSCVGCWPGGRCLTRRVNWLALVCTTGHHASWKSFLMRPKCRISLDFLILTAGSWKYSWISCEHVYFKKSIHLISESPILTHKIIKEKKWNHVMFCWDKVSFITGKGKEWGTICCLFPYSMLSSWWKLKNSANYLDILVCLIKNDV